MSVQTIFALTLILTLGRQGNAQQREGELSEPRKNCTMKSDCQLPERCIGMWTSKQAAYLRYCELQTQDEVSTGEFNIGRCKCHEPPPSCQTSAECSTGYRCVRSKYMEYRPMCIHCNYAAAIRTYDSSIFESVDTMPDCTPSASPIPSAISTILYSTLSDDGNTWDECSDRLPPCRGNRTCAKWRQNLGPLKACDASSDFRNCYCRLNNEEEGCQSSIDCLKGDRCVRMIHKASLKFEQTLCVSCAYVSYAVDIQPVDGGADKCFTRLSTNADSGGNGSGSEGSDNGGSGQGGSNNDGSDVCIDANALRHLPDRQLVYATHQWGNVLCDTYNSCATPGHMVVYRNEVMMMTSYCDRYAKCQRRSMLVNSARMKRKVRIESSTPGLQYTVFAARFETRLEERLLRSVVHFGL